MVFHRTRNLPLGLAAKMSKEGHAVALLTVESTPDQCIAVLSRVRDSKEKVLITISLMVRGAEIACAKRTGVNIEIPRHKGHRYQMERVISIFYGCYSVE